MKILHLKNNCVNFTSGLTNQIRLSEKLTNTKTEESFFSEEFGVESQFLNNKSAALANKICIRIFNDLANNFNIDLTPPPSIFVYEEGQIINKDSAPNFCIPETTTVLKHESPFLGRALFFRDFKNLDEIDSNTEKLFKNKISSSPHFIAPFIHEWLHSFQLDYIFQKFGYGGECDYMKEIYPNKENFINGIEMLKVLKTKTLTPAENQIVYEELGLYSTKPENQYLEIFSEALTKFICSSLSGADLIKNPLNQFKKTNSEFQKIFKKVCLLK